ncbi:MAG: LacI family DNA-binding transcriptional regulator [Anaerolineales bacterium]
MPMNLDEIARLSGVSRSTVSRVVNNDPKVSDRTRLQVQEVLQRVNFHPNAAARSLAAGRSRVLGLVIPMGVAALFTDPYFPLLIQGVSAAANAHDHSVMLWVAEPEYERRTIGQVMQNGLIDGVILASMLSDDPLLRALIQGSLPFVLVGRHPTNTTINYIDVDNINSARQAVTHLLRLGRRRIATITGPQNMSVGADRAEGYLAALRQRGLTVDPSLIVEGDFTEAGAHAAMQRLLPLNPDAVFAASDVMAVGALRALREAGRRVPEDIALIGFDDMPFSARTDPPLTTVRQPVQRTGEVAAETLIDLIEHPDAQPRRILLPTELVIRASCGSKLA